MLLPVGLVIVTEPVDTEQEGCVRLKTGACGAEGAALIVTDVAFDSQPEVLSFTLIE